MNELRVVPGAPLYELTGAAKTYGQGDTRVRALDGIDLVIHRGEFLVIAGSSGSGKTTLLQLLGGLDHPSSGSIRFDGRDLAAAGDGELTELRLERVGFIFQQFNLVPTLNAQQNVEAALAPRRLKGSARTERARELLASVGLSPRANHLPSQLSGGEQQRVAIARALANDPDVLLADEPTGNLDTGTGREVMDVLARLNAERGSTLVLVTHDRAIAQGASRSVQMRDGRLAEEEEPRLRRQLVE